MYRVALSEHFAAAHSLRDVGGVCERLHGHNWRVEVVAERPEPDRIGLVVDFAVLREELKRILSPFDHACLNELPPFRTKNPSAENVARFVHDRLSPVLRRLRVRLRAVTVWETAGCSATFEPPSGGESRPRRR